MQCPFLLRPMIQVADSLQIGLRRTSRLGGGPLNENYQSLFTNHISGCLPICLNLRFVFSSLCAFAALREFYSSSYQSPLMLPHIIDKL
jgi:hypothetical protein